MRRWFSCGWCLLCSRRWSAPTGKSDATPDGGSQERVRAAKIDHSLPMTPPGEYCDARTSMGDGRDAEYLSQEVEPSKFRVATERKAQPLIISSTQIHAILEGAGRPTCGSSGSTRVSRTPKFEPMLSHRQRVVNRIVCWLHFHSSRPAAVFAGKYGKSDICTTHKNTLAITKHTSPLESTLTFHLWSSRSATLSYPYLDHHDDLPEKPPPGNWIQYHEFIQEGHVSKWASFNTPACPVSLATPLTTKAG